MTARRPGPVARPLPPGWQEPGEQYLQWLRAGGQTYNTLRLKRHYLIRLGTQSGRGPWQVTTEDLTAFLAEPGWKPETRKSAQSTVKNFYRWAVSTGLAEHDPTVGLLPARTPAGAPKPASEDAVRRALAAAGPRERLMVLLGATVGLRASEIAAVHTRDVEQRLDGWWLRVNGKGAKVRVVPLSSELAAEIRRYPAGYLFPSCYAANDHLSASYVGILLKRLLGKELSAHTLRHRFATQAYAANRDLLAVQQLLGHSKPETTARYTALPGDALRLAAAQAALS